jgi:hypothetical protein
MKKVQKPRKSLLALALASAVSGAALMSAAPAHAVNIAQDGVGEVLLFPYYTVRNGWDTYVHLTNTSTDTVLAKIRFREAKNSREVRDFNLILSPNDQWTGAVTIDGSGAKLVSYDTSCTSPILPLVDEATGRREIGFTSIGYDGSDANYHYDNGGLGLGRTQEGHLEVIVMGVSSASTSSSANTIEYNAKHVSTAAGYVPRSCATVDAAFVQGTDTANLSSYSGFSTFSAPTNVLKGYSTLINVASGIADGVAPTAIANFQNTQPIIYQPGSLFPSLADGTLPATANFIDDTGNGTLVSAAPIAASEDAVSLLLQRRYVLNEFSTAAAANVKSDWVITFPTKYNYVDDGGVASTAGTAIAPFSEWFAKQPDVLSNHTGKSCVSIQLDQFGREEQAVASTSSTAFSPRPSGPSGAQLCNEVNVLTFNGSDLLGSSVKAYDVSTTSVGSAGWARLRLAPSSVTLAGEGDLTAGGVTYFGLPVNGFAMVVRNNAAEAGNNRNYATVEEHSYSRELYLVP